jgi:hypothetical protein
MIEVWPRIGWRLRPPLCVVLCACQFLSACQPGLPSQALTLKSESQPTDVMVAVARSAQDCWFRSNDRAFREYRLADEVNSPAGRPRILLVPRQDPAALPLLVVQAEQRGDLASGRYTDIQTFGPILASPSGKRIADDVRRWSGGDRACR